MWEGLAILAVFAAVAVAIGRGSGGGVPLSGGLAEIVASLQQTPRGGRVGPATSIDSTGTVRDDPRGLALKADTDLQVYTLARALTSEHGSDGPLIQICVAHAVLNNARRAGMMVFKRCVGSGDRYGKQGTGTRSYIATRADPREREVLIAAGSIGGQIPDPTGGATNFFSPKAQDWLYKEGRTSKDAAMTDAKWQAGGLKPIQIAGIDPRVVTFYRKG